jgi:hypothetical protein
VRPARAALQGSGWPTAAALRAPLPPLQQRAAPALAPRVRPRARRPPGEGAKRRLEQNQARLAALRAAILVSTAVYAAVRLYLRAASRSGWHWLGLAVTLLASGASYLMIAAAAQPTYSAAGALLDGGSDLNKGVVSSYHDIL